MINSLIKKYGFTTCICFLFAAAAIAQHSEVKIVDPNSGNSTNAVVMDLYASNKCTSQSKNINDLLECRGITKDEKKFIRKNKGVLVQQTSTADSKNIKIIITETQAHTQNNPNTQLEISEN